MVGVEHTFPPLPLLGKKLLTLSQICPSEDLIKRVITDYAILKDHPSPSTRKYLVETGVNICTAISAPLLKGEGTHAECFFPN
jgi:hypothetical protein